MLSIYITLFICALTFELDLSLKQQKDEIMNEISRMKSDFSTKTSATSTTISGITDSSKNALHVIQCIYKHLA